MGRRDTRAATRALAGAVITAVVITSGLPAVAAPPTTGRSETTTPATRRETPSGLATPDPMLAMLADPTSVDMPAANRARAARSAARAAARRRAATSMSAATYPEREFPAVIGANDSAPIGEPIVDFGAGPGERTEVSVTGTLAANPDIVSVLPGAEDNGAVPIASDAGAMGPEPRTIRIASEIGDGPHGDSGDGHGDFDFYKLSDVPAGAVLTVETEVSTGYLDTIIVIYHDGVVASNDSDGARSDSLLRIRIAEPGAYYVMVGGVGVGDALPRDFTDPASGPGVSTEGPYELTISTGQIWDTDIFTADLKAGDVVGAVVNGAATHVSVLNPAGDAITESAMDVTAVYPDASPLPGGGNAAVDLVAPRDGRYGFAVSNGVGGYDVTLQAYRPGSETTAAGTIQTIFLDFDGALVDGELLFSYGVRWLSPLSSFLSGWGLEESDEDALIDAVTATVKENLASDLAERGTNPNTAIRVIDSRQGTDPFGEPDVSRVVVGGTQYELGVETIGISESIDPGNFNREESAVVLLDVLTAGPDIPGSLTPYLSGECDRIAFLGRALGNLVSHEAGHFSGSYHTDPNGETVQLMDLGDVFHLTGVGPDKLGGSPDDVDVDFGEDGYAIEAFTGVEDTLNRTAWAYGSGVRP